MKKIFVLGVVLGAILALGGLAFAVYTANTARAADAPSQLFAFDSGFGTWREDMAFQGHGPGGPGFGPGDRQNPLAPYIEAAVADILGISAEDLQAARENRAPMSDLLDAAGLTADEFQAALEAAVPGIVEQALTDEAISQEQADFILENGLQFFHRRGGPGGPGGFGGLKGDGSLQTYVEAAIADILGISVEDLQTARENGTRMPELLEAAGLTAEEFQAAMEEAVPGIAEQALADGVITQAQADFILENGLRGFGPGGRGLGDCLGGPGGQGPHGGRFGGPGGFGPGNSDAPTNSASSVNG